MKGTLIRANFQGQGNVIYFTPYGQIEKIKLHELLEKYGNDISVLLDFDDPALEDEFTELCKEPREKEIKLSGDFVTATLHCATLTWITFKDGTTAVYSNNDRKNHFIIRPGYSMTINIIPKKEIYKKTNKTYLQWLNRWGK